MKEHDYLFRAISFHRHIGLPIRCLSGVISPVNLVSFGRSRALIYEPGIRGYKVKKFVKIPVLTVEKSMITDVYPPHTPLLIRYLIKSCLFVYEKVKIGV